MKLDQQERFRRWVVEELERRNWSQKHLAVMTGISPTHVSNVLRGLRAVSWDFVFAVARAFNRSPFEVARIAGLLPPLSDDVQQLTEIAAQLDERDRRLLLEVARALLLSSSLRKEE